MTRIRASEFAVLVIAGAMVASTRALSELPSVSVRTPDEIAVLEIDARQREAVMTRNLERLGEITHPHYRVNAPTNHILTREDLIRMVGSGEIGHDVFERTPETIVITGDVGVVMGTETVVPVAGSGQAQLFGQRTLNRRFTNVYLRENGVWRQLARHANVVP